MARGDVIIVDFPSPAGSSGREQIGTRPAVVVQSGKKAATLPTTIVIPFTSKLSASKFPYTVLVNPSSQNGLTTQSVMLIFHVRAIDNKRIGRKLGRLEKNYFERLNDGLKSLLGF